MGVKKLSKAYKNTKKIRDNFLLENEKEKADPNTTPILINLKVNNKRLGVDFSVVLHKALGNDIEGEQDEVTIVEIKCTPSMKSEVYGVCVIFRSDGVYLPKKS